MSDQQPLTVDWDLARRTIQARLGEKKLSDQHWAHFVHVAKAKGLDPLQNQLAISLHYNKKSRDYDMAIITQIDGHRLIADRTGGYAGSDDAEYTWNGDSKPLSAKVTVYKMVEGQRCPFAATAFMDEYNPGTLMWQRMGRLMIAKCAEALALRKAFPAELSGLYVDEEMHQAERPEREPKSKPQVNVAKLKENLQAWLQENDLTTADAAIKALSAKQTVQAEAKKVINDHFKAIEKADAAPQGDPRGVLAGVE